MQDHPKRYIFNHVHHNMGRLALAFGIVAVFLGLKVTGVRASLAPDSVAAKVNCDLHAFRPLGPGNMAVLMPTCS